MVGALLSAPISSDSVKNLARNGQGDTMYALVPLSGAIVAVAVGYWWWYRRKRRGDEGLVGSSDRPPSPTTSRGSDSGSQCEDCNREDDLEDSEVVASAPPIVVPEPPRLRELRQSLEEIDEALRSLPRLRSQQRQYERAAAGRTLVSVVVGNTAMARADPTLPRRVVDVINSAYGRQRIDEDDVWERLEMGDPEPRANRVLHLAWIGGEPSSPSARLVGACSSTYATPWCERGCGHWGLMAVAPSAQGQGVASALVAAAETRLAAQCTQCQIEYNYAPGDAESERLMAWYEGKLGFQCPYSKSKPHFRRCRKHFEPDLMIRGRVHFMMNLRNAVMAEIADVAPDAVLSPLEIDGKPMTIEEDNIDDIDTVHLSS